MTLGSPILDERAHTLSTIKNTPFRITASILFALALLSVLSRICLKIRHSRNFHLDDYILFFGTACLIAGTGMLFSGLDSFYLGPVIQSQPELVSLVPPKFFPELQRQLGFIYAMLTLIWTTTFAVKLSFLAFFRDIVRAVPGMKWYYRATIWTTIVAWAYINSTPFIVCSQFGAKSVTCFQNPDMRLYAGLTYFGTILDCLTDLMIVSIPIFILHRSRIQLRQKLAVGTFLCLSIVMVAISITRSAKIQGPPGVPEDVTWMLFWVYSESAIAILMVSLTAFRTVFNLKKEEESRKERLKKPPTYRQYENYERKQEKDVEAATMQGLPEIPSATLQGVDAFIRWNGRLESDTKILSLGRREELSPSASVSDCEKKSVESFV